MCECRIGYNGIFTMFSTTSIRYFKFYINATSIINDNYTQPLIELEWLCNTNNPTNYLSTCYFAMTDIIIELFDIPNSIQIDTNFITKNIILCYLPINTTIDVYNAIQVSENQYSLGFIGINSTIAKGNKTTLCKKKKDMCCLCMYVYSQNVLSLLCVFGMV